jgi:hypothetical protein
VIAASLRVERAEGSAGRCSLGLARRLPAEPLGVIPEMLHLIAENAEQSVQATDDWVAPRYSILSAVT